MSVDVRTIAPSELHDWLRAMAVGFLGQPEISDEETERRRPAFDLDRTQGAFDGGRCVATFRSFSQELTVVGGAAVSANAVTNVTVSPSHRRRGLLSRMMASDLAPAKERGDTVATLIAAEYPIYGRFGFGPAASTTTWRIDVNRAGLNTRGPVPADGGRIDLVDGAEVRKEGPELYERVRAQRAGFVDRSERKWESLTGLLRFPSVPWTEPYHVLYRSPGGQVDGLLTYTADPKWEGMYARCVAKVSDLIAATPEAERALWHYVMSVDWIQTVDTGMRAPDDLVPLFLPDPRAARIAEHTDLFWLRLLDVPRALEARTYAVPGTLVLEVVDRAGLAGGRFRLEASPQGASCAPTTASADLTLDVRELGALYLGDESVARQVALGLVEEHRTGAAELANALFGASRRPWCPDIF
ncbi:GNAT family N-acetyltransferase [Streptomyces meridianus]|uniref:GNAT family N-acetyltransferase n=1 Tax=Streptomyces meridianus TaxID=2938945 RepID=A0ABT0X441_9ACTN|nr:GNAT family N-acetyltransferase [Streptomyces meridianus]MCM2577315.1 GNAT family N-acetyltransferase [Streptomyces meridianus]